LSGFHDISPPSWHWTNSFVSAAFETNSTDCGFRYLAAQPPLLPLKNLRSAPQKRRSAPKTHQPAPQKHHPAPKTPHQAPKKPLPLRCPIVSLKTWT
jgi:hypothetical protein